MRAIPTYIVDQFVQNTVPELQLLNYAVQGLYLLGLSLIANHEFLIRHKTELENLGQLVSRVSKQLDMPEYKAKILCREYFKKKSQKNNIHFDVALIKKCFDLKENNAAKFYDLMNELKIEELLKSVDWKKGACVIANFATSLHPAAMVGGLAVNSALLVYQSTKVSGVKVQSDDKAKEYDHLERECYTY